MTTPNPTIEQPEKWKTEARIILSKICCDGQYIDEAIAFVTSLLTQEREKVLDAVDAYTEHIQAPHVNRGWIAEWILRRISPKEPDNK